MNISYLSDPRVIQSILIIAVGLAAVLFLIHLTRTAEESTGGLTSGTWGGRRLGFFDRDMRRAERKNCSIQVLVNDRYTMDPTEPGKVVNLSNSGACITTPASLYIGGRFIGEVTSYHHRGTRLEGEIVWVRPEGHSNSYGIRFQ